MEKRSISSHSWTGHDTQTSSTRAGIRRGVHVFLHFFHENPLLHLPLLSFQERLPACHKHSVGISFLHFLHRSFFVHVIFFSFTSASSTLLSADLHPQGFACSQASTELCVPADRHLVFVFNVMLGTVPRNSIHSQLRFHRAPPDALPPDQLVDSRRHQNFTSSWMKWPEEGGRGRGRRGRRKEEEGGRGRGRGGGGGEERREKRLD